MKLFDCMITYGELDPERYGHYKEGTIGQEVVKHNVTREEALAWHGSAECMKRVQELEDLGREKFGKDHWMNGMSAISGRQRRKIRVRFPKLEMVLTRLRCVTSLVLIF